MRGWADHAVRDVAFAIRSLSRAPAFVAVAVMTLGLGIGATTAVFTVLYNTLLRPLPYPDADRLVNLSLVSTSDARGARTISLSYPKFQEIARASRSFDALAAYARQAVTISGVGDTDRIVSEIVSASYFPILGVEPALGRGFRPEEDATPGSHPVVMVSDSFWRARLGGRRDALGRAIRVNGVPLVVVGVAPRGFKGESNRADVWVPMMMAAAVLHSPGSLNARQQHWHQVVGRLRTGVTLRQADEEVRAIVSRMPDSSGAGWRTSGSVERLDASKRDPRLGALLRVLFGAAACVLLIASANVGNLLLARGLGRQREIGIRLAIGARRGLIVRQLLLESLLLSSLAASVGLLLAAWSMRAMALVRPQDETGPWPTYVRQLDLDAFGVSGAVYVFSLLLCAVTTVLAGLLPAWLASGPELQTTLKADATSWGATGRRARLWRPLIAVQVALVVVLLTGAGLMVRSFDRLLRQPMGFEPDGVLTFRVALRTDAYDRDGVRGFYERLTERVAALPGVESVARARALPGVERGTVTQIRLDGEPSDRYVGYNAVTPAFLRTLRTRVVSGRAFDERDADGRPAVSMVDESSARRLFGGQNPLGRRLVLMGVATEIVGVIGDVHYEPQRQQLPIEGDVYVPLAQREGWSSHVLVRAAGDPLRLMPDLRRVLAELDPEVPLYDSKTMDEHLAGVRSFTRFTTLLLTITAAVALSLAIAGIYATLSYAVAARQREIGIRMALGARRGDVIRMVLREGLTVCGAGAAAGLPLAYAAARSMRSLVYGVAPSDVAPVAIAIAVVGVTASLACAAPARRAAQVSPFLVLRN